LNNLGKRDSADNSFGNHGDSNTFLEKKSTSASVKFAPELEENGDYNDDDSDEGDI